MSNELQALLERVSYMPLAVPEDLAPMVLLMANSSAPLGFPSPAEDFNCEPVDVMKKLMPYPQSMFLLRVKGPSKRDDGVFDDDILVDRERRHWRTASKAGHEAGAENAKLHHRLE